MQINIEQIIWRLENLDEWGEEDFWWKNLLKSYKQRFKAYVPAAVDCLRQRIVMQDDLDPRGYFLCVVKIFSRDAILNAALIEELTVLLLADNQPFLEKVDELVKSTPR